MALFFFLLFYPLLILAQNASQPNQTVVTSTSLSTVVGLGPNRQTTTGTSTFVFVNTLTPAPQPSGNGTNGNNTQSGNSTVSSNSTSKAPPLPTAPTNIEGGGQNGAPLPGQTGVGGNMGPDDNYIAAATALKHNAFAVGVMGVVLGGAMVLF
ncbi:hypothetical protein AGABI1DRAFT_124182 [Agaricus bisporus var. burnettii JB137-S8]|uniref:Uncharacterized protein n=1 Tax=Agaricus bisporus var. burnettii (strain JB137-S8 / ATCC MYA-4627 / FGSC 10392) TaxID=597362 RepID=K5X7G5_AGABU|nr:uncharacterized protein AGABI1DRAFT_124182 [Agaricus bisporus var. burnettii JB137-S8]EKM83856.1 hypothetical protein AGABI1DRAFT_124182 [Agaricus bisporus var. burnettii JB137-S8]